MIQPARAQVSRVPSVCPVRGWGWRVGRALRSPSTRGSARLGCHWKVLGFTKFLVGKFAFRQAWPTEGP